MGGKRPRQSTHRLLKGLNQRNQQEEGVGEEKVPGFHSGVTRVSTGKPQGLHLIQQLLKPRASPRGCPRCGPAGPSTPAPTRAPQRPPGTPGKACALTGLMVLSTQSSRNRETLRPQRPDDEAEDPTLLPADPAVAGPEGLCYPAQPPNQTGGRAHQHRGRTHPACAACAPAGSRGPPRCSAPRTAAAASPGSAGASAAAGRAGPGPRTASCSSRTDAGAPRTSPAGRPGHGRRGRGQTGRLRGEVGCDASSTVAASC